MSQGPFFSLHTHVRCLCVSLSLPSFRFVQFSIERARAFYQNSLFICTYVVVIAVVVMPDPTALHIFVELYKHVQVFSKHFNWLTIKISEASILVFSPSIISYKRSSFYHSLATAKPMTWSIITLVAAFIPLFNTPAMLMVCLAAGSLDCIKCVVCIKAG